MKLPVSGPIGPQGPSASFVLPGFGASVLTGTVINTIFAGKAGVVCSRIAVLPGGTLTHSATNYRTWNIQEFDIGNNLITNNIATGDTTTTDWSSGVEVVLFSGSFTMTSDDNRLIVNWQSVNAGIILPVRAYTVR